MAKSDGLVLEGKYEEAHRRYHTLRHIECVLRDAGWLADELNLNFELKAILMVAVCAHDVIYDRMPGEDERASAEWAATHLAAAGVAKGAVEAVSRAVLATIAHEVDPSDLLVTCLLDADLAVLGASADVYDQYSVDVRIEYDKFDDATWKLGRSHVLRQLLDRPRLFLTEPGRSRWESAARSNLDRELGRLGMAA